MKHEETRARLSVVFAVTVQGRTNTVTIVFSHTEESGKTRHLKHTQCASLSVQRIFAGKSSCNTFNIAPCRALKNQAVFQVKADQL